MIFTRAWARPFSSSRTISRWRIAALAPCLCAMVISSRIIGDDASASAELALFEAAFAAMDPDVVRHCARRRGLRCDAHREQIHLQGLRQNSRSNRWLDAATGFGRRV